MSESKETRLQFFFAWAPHIAVFGGLFMMWIYPSVTGLILMYAGFIMYGILGAWASISRKYYQGISLKLMKLLIQISIVLMAVLPLISEFNSFIWILLLIIMDTVIFTSTRIEPDPAN